MSKDLLVLADEYAAATATFARALALKDSADSMSPIAREAGDKRAVLAEALAALDAAQPVQVNAMLVEALQAAEKLEHEALVALSETTDELKVGNTYTTATDTYKAHNDLIHRLDKILNSQYRDRKRTALTAAQQAQPERAPLSDKFLQPNDYHLLYRFIETTEDDEGYDITKAEIKRLADLGVVQSHGFGKYSVTMFGYWVHERYWEQTPSLPLKTNSDRTAEAAHGIKQGGQHD